MQRDMELVRKIFLAIEECPDRNGLREVVIEGYTKEFVDYHLVMLHTEGLISGINHHTNAQHTVLCAQLEWAGHEFLNAARSDTIWNKAKAKIKEKGLELGTLPISLLGEYLKHMVKDQLGLP